MKRSLTRMIQSGVLALAFCSVASADSIIKFPLSETNVPDVQFTSGFFSTVDDGNAASFGDQDTRIEFTGFLNFLADIDSPTASFTINGVGAVGAPTTTAGVVVQETSGGTFSLYDSSNTLLLSGDLSNGAITGGSGDTGSFFNTTFAAYTGGSLLAYIAPTPAGISIALAGILSGDVVGLVTDGFLHDFTADASGLATGEPSNPIPEPGTLGLLFSSGLVGLRQLKRRRLAE